MPKADVRSEQFASFFLARLERLCNLEARYVSPPDVLTDPRRLVCKAIFATYCDCVALGRKAEAERVVEAARRRGASPPTPSSSPS
jgi:hypothetical protein